MCGWWWMETLWIIVDYKESLQIHSGQPCEQQIDLTCLACIRELMEFSLISLRGDRVAEQEKRMWEEFKQSCIWFSVRKKCHSVSMFSRHSQNNKWGGLNSVTPSSEDWVKRPEEVLLIQKKTLWELTGNTQTSAPHPRRTSGNPGICSLNKPHARFSLVLKCKQRWEISLPSMSMKRFANTQPQAFYSKCCQLDILTSSLLLQRLRTGRAGNATISPFFLPSSPV